jgi:hypothetical protein
MILSQVAFNGPSAATGTASGGEKVITTQVQEHKNVDQSLPR